jgi:tetratricopeptide (TPR) repeat protein
MPAVSPEARYFLNIMFAVIAVCAFIIGVIWALNAGYAGYQDRLQEGKVAAHLQRGKEYFDQESFQAAAEEFAQALKLTSDAELQKKLRENIAVCYISIGDRSLNNGDMQTAMDWWSKAGSISPESPAVVERTARVYLLYGNRAAQSGDVNTAMDWWQKAQEIGPGTQSGITAGENIRRFMGSGYGP